MNDYLLSSDDLLGFMKEVWNFNRSITGEGVRQTLQVAKQFIPELEIQEVPTGVKFWDWTVPPEWRFKSAQIFDSQGGVVLDAKNSNLHVVSYSHPINTKLSLDELQKKLFSSPDLPDAIPYRTSYYKKDWGFCISENERKRLKPGDYQVLIDTDFIDGSMTLGQIYIPGKVKSEILFTTYTCHPSMANNELSGPAIALGIASFLSQFENYYSYRILFVPETIGSIYFLSKNLDYLKKYLIAGYVLTCLGDDLAWNYMPSRTGITLSDKIAKRVLDKLQIDYVNNSFLARGSDERQYCSPRINLPVCSVMRSKYGTYPEYHTSKDNLEFISKNGLEKSFKFYKELIYEFESNRIPVTQVFGEPMLSKYNLREIVGGGALSNRDSLVTNIIAYADASNDFFEIAKIIGTSLHEVKEIAYLLNKNRLIKIL